MNFKKLLDILMWIPGVNYMVMTGLLFYRVFIRREPITFSLMGRMLGTFLLTVLVFVGAAALLLSLLGVKELGSWGHLLIGLIVMPALIRVLRKDMSL